MTVREQTKIDIFNGLPLGEDTSTLYALVDEICDKYESRTCENCKYNYVLHGNVNYCSLLEQDKMKHCSEFVSTDTKGEEYD